MTIDDTRAVLAFLYSCYPSAPKLTREDKDRMIISFFRVLYRYEKSDVLDAVVNACKASPMFIPSVYTIELGIKITPPELDFLENDREIYLYKKYKHTNVFGEIQSCTDAETRAEMMEFLGLYPSIITRRNQALKQAESQYYAANIQAASQDIKHYLGVNNGKENTNSLK